MKDDVCRILVIGDSADLLNGATWTLRNAGRGFEVARAYDTTHALKQLTHGRTSLIIAELANRTVDVGSLIDGMRSDPRLPLVPVVGVLEDRWSQAEFDPGCDALLTLPLNPDALLATVTRCLNRHDDLRQAS